MASYEYPKAMDVNFRSPKSQQYPISEMAVNTPKKVPDHFSKSPEKSPERASKKGSLIPPPPKRRIFSCFSFKYSKKSLHKYFNFFPDIGNLFSISARKNSEEELC